MLRKICMRGCNTKTWLGPSNLHAHWTPVMTVRLAPCNIPPISVGPQVSHDYKATTPVYFMWRLCLTPGYKVQIFIMRIDVCWGVIPWSLVWVSQTCQSPYVNCIFLLQVSWRNCWKCWRSVSMCPDVVRLPVGTSDILRPFWFNLAFLAVRLLRR